MEAEQALSEFKDHLAAKVKDLVDGDDDVDPVEDIGRGEDSGAASFAESFDAAFFDEPELEVDIVVGKPGIGTAFIGYYYSLDIDMLYRFVECSGA